MSYTIRIGSTSDTSGIDKATGALKRADAAAEEFVESIKAGVGIDIGGRLVNGISRIPGVLQDAVTRGVQFNTTIENTQTAVAAVLEKFQGLSRDKALSAAGDAVDELKRKAVAAPGTIQQLAEAWIASAGAASAANIPINQQIDLMVRLSQAVSRLALPQAQLVQETRALLTGNITLDAQLAKTLGVTNEQIRAAKEQGNLYEFLVGKIGALGEASDTLEVRWSNFNDALDQTLGKATEPIFAALRDSIGELTKSIDNPKTIASLRAIGIEIGNAVKSGTALTEWAIKNAPALALVAKSAGLLAVAMAAIKLAQIIQGMVQWTLSLGTSRAAIDAETASLARNTAAQAANASARRAGAATGGLPGAAAAAGGGKVVSSVLGGVAVVGIVNAIAEAIKSAQQADLENQRSGVNDRLSEQAKLTKRANAVQTPAERDDVIASIQEFLGKGGENRKYADGLGKVIDRLRARTDLLTPEQASAQSAADRATQEREARRAENMAALDSQEKNLQVENRRRTNDAADSPEKINERIGQLRAMQREAASVTDTSAPNFVEASNTVREIRQEIEDLQNRAAELVRKQAEDEKKASEQATKDRISGLQEEMALIEAMGRERIAAAEASSTNELDAARARKDIEDEVARKKLEIENQIGQLNGESVTAMQARAVAARADQIERDNRLRSLSSPAETPSTATQQGELFAGTRRRRGIGESDAFGENALNLTPGQSLLDQYNLNQARPVGAINGKSILPADPSSSLRPPTSPGGNTAGGTNQNGSAQGLAAVAETFNKSGDLQAVGQQISTAVEKLTSATGNKAKELDALKKQLAAVAAKLEALAKKI